MRIVRMLSLLGVAGYFILTSIGCCCNPCYPYRTTPYYCAPAACFQPSPASSCAVTASNSDRIAPVPMTR